MVYVQVKEIVMDQLEFVFVILVSKEAFALTFHVLVGKNNAMAMEYAIYPQESVIVIQIPQAWIVLNGFALPIVVTLVFVIFQLENAHVILVAMVLTAPNSVALKTVCAPIMEFVMIHWELAFVILDMKEKLAPNSVVL